MGGIERIKAVKTLRITGRATVGPGLEAPIVMEQARPNRMRMEMVVQGVTIVQAFDGTTGWQIMPTMGDGTPQPMSADEARTVGEQAEFDLPFIDYRARGSTVAYVGRDSAGGVAVHRLRVTRRSGEATDFLVDASTYLVVGTVQKRTLGGTPVELESTIGDYRPVAGVLMPHRVEQGVKGTPQRQRFVIDRMEANVALDPGRFTMPAAGTAPAAP